MDRNGQAVTCEGSGSQTWDGPALIELKPHAVGWSRIDLAWRQLGQEQGYCCFIFMSWKLLWAWGPWRRQNFFHCSLQATLFIRREWRRLQRLELTSWP